MKFKKRINLFEDFKSEIAAGTKTKTNEVPVNTTKPEAGVEAKTELLKDVDAILNNLETLSAQIGEAKEFIYGFIAECHSIITEQLGSETPNQELIDEVLAEYLEVLEDLEINAQLNEAGEDKVGKKMWQFVYWAPKARKAQKKVNKLKLNKKALDLAADDAENKEQAASLKAKSLRVKTQMDDLQKIVDDRFKDKGEYVQGVVRRQKQEGQLELIKQETGMSDDPDRKADLVQQAKEIQKKSKEEEAALKELEPSEADKKAAAEKLKKEQEEIEKAKAAAKAAKTNDDEEQEDGGTEGEAKSAEQVATEALGAAKSEYTKITADQQGDMVDVPATEEGGEPTQKPKWTDIKKFKGKDAEGQDTDEEVIYAKEDTEAPAGGDDQTKSAEQVATEALGAAKSEYTKITADQQGDMVDVPATEEGGEPTQKPKWTDIKKFKGKDAEGQDTAEEVIYAKQNDNQSFGTSNNPKLYEGMSIADKFRALM